jgi:glucose/arabinose dehydrogenase
MDEVQRGLWKAWVAGAAAIVVSACGGSLGPGTSPRDSAADVFPTSWTKCATDPEVCVVEGTRVVRFGLSTSADYIDVVKSGGVWCDISSFGGTATDPAPGQRKSCWIGSEGAVPENPPPSPPAPPPEQPLASNEAALPGKDGWRLCATDPETCHLPGRRTIRFGLSTSADFVDVVSSGNVWCDISSFGGTTTDPAPGRRKSCWFADAAAPEATATAGWTRCATDPETCAVPGTRTVRFGLSTTNAYIDVVKSGDVWCDISSFGGTATDPAPGQRKSCWISATAPAPAAAPTAPAPAPVPVPPAAAPANAASVVPKATVLFNGLSRPWGLAFLPDGRMLVTQKAGSLVILSADGQRIESSVSGVPAVDGADQGGLLDVVLDPDFASDPWVYLTYSESLNGLRGTAVARARLRGAALQDFTVLLRQTPYTGSAGHYGSRLAFGKDKTLFVAFGERQQDNPEAPTTAWAQNPANYYGKVVRIARDGSIPGGNPDFGPGAAPGLWSIGHRNPQGIAVHPTTGEVWVIEHGPLGGDELNRALPGRNFGWPLRSYGCPYSAGTPSEGCRVGGGTHAPTFEEPVSVWGPYSIAPAGLLFYTGNRFPEWRGHLLTGALAGKALWRVELTGAAQAARASYFTEVGERLRHVVQGPDGWVYVLTDSGKLMRVER